MRRIKNTPAWLEGVILYGFDESGKGSGDGDEPGEEDDDDDEDDDEGKKGGQGDTEGLKSALRKERRERKNYEKQFKALKKQLEEKGQQEQDDLTKATAEAERERQKAAKLAAKLAKEAVDNSILKLATKANFIDPEDAVALIDREALEWDQDDDDPSQVTVDRDSVQEALNKLKKERPHLLVAEGDGRPSGGKFGGSRNNGGGSKETEEQKLSREAQNYPAMRHHVRRQQSSN